METATATIVKTPRPTSLNHPFGVETPHGLFLIDDLPPHCGVGETVTARYDLEDQFAQVDGLPLFSVDGEEPLTLGQIERSCQPDDTCLTDEGFVNPAQAVARFARMKVGEIMTCGGGSCADIEVKRVK